MRIAVLCIAVLLLSACTAMVLGNGSSGGASSTSTPASSDASLSERVKARFAADSTVSVFSLNVRSYSGSVILSGSVDSYVAREQAGKLAKATSGVRAVTNQIIVDK